MTQKKEYLEKRSPNRPKEADIADASSESIFLASEPSDEGMGNRALPVPDSPAPNNGPPEEAEDFSDTGTLFLSELEDDDDIPVGPSASGGTPQFDDATVFAPNGDLASLEDPVPEPPPPAESAETSLPDTDETFVDPDQTTLAGLEADSRPSPPPPVLQPEPLSEESGNESVSSIEDMIDDILNDLPASDPPEENIGFDDRTVIAPNGDLDAIDLTETDNGLLRDDAEEEDASVQSAETIFVPMEKEGAETDQNDFDDRVFALGSDSFPDGEEKSESAGFVNPDDPQENEGPLREQSVFDLDAEMLLEPDADADGGAGKKDAHPDEALPESETVFDQEEKTVFAPIEVSEPDAVAPEALYTDETYDRHAQTVLAGDAELAALHSEPEAPDDDGDGGDGEIEDDEILELGGEAVLEPDDLTPSSDFGDDIEDEDDEILELNGDAILDIEPESDGRTVVISPEEMAPGADSEAEDEILELGGEAIVDENDDSTDEDSVYDLDPGTVVLPRSDIADEGAGEEDLSVFELDGDDIVDDDDDPIDLDEILAAADEAQGISSDAAPEEDREYPPDEIIDAPTQAVFNEGAAGEDETEEGESALDILSGLVAENGGTDGDDAVGLMDFLNGEAGIGAPSDDDLPGMTASRMASEEASVSAEKEPDAAGEPSKHAPPPEDGGGRFFSVTPEQMETALERVINRIFTRRIEKVLKSVIEDAVQAEIRKISRELMEDIADPDEDAV